MGILNRTDIINLLINKHSYRKYLEIGAGLQHNLNGVNASIKHGVDTVGDNTFKMTSDEFFKINTSMYDLIFIDGLHEYQQVMQDILNSLAILNPRGTIVVHDCNPPTEIIQKVPRESGEWTGDVWKAISSLRMTRPDLSVYVIDTDWGCGIIRKGTQILFPKTNNLTYDFLDKNRSKLLNLIDDSLWLSIIA